MKVPISWLKEYVDFDDSVQGLADKLTFSGVEVEGIETVGGAFTGLVVGEVLSVMPHPNAERLTICRVSDGSIDVQVVCGAPNVALGQKVPFAPIGSVLPNGMKMKKAKIRQMDSFGMLLAEDELGLSDDHTGLMLLDPHSKAGTPLADVLGPPETVLDLEITPNRPDCLSLMGIAREVATLYGSSLKEPSAQIAESDAAVTDCTDVQVTDSDGCPRYTARVLNGVTIGPSPAWMQKRLTLAGIRPINNVVDITNYVMLETGHPLHAFDQDLLAEGRVVIRRATPSERMHTLDDVERELSSDMLVIADANRPVAVAGVMGGAGSEIRDETTTVLLEAACFDPLLTRNTARALALSTESSYRFERGVDAESVEWASRRAAKLLAEYAGATLVAGVIDHYPAPVGPAPITCRWSFVRSVTGMLVDDDTVASILTALGLTIVDRDADGFTVSPPSFRRDLERAVDLVEEVARIHGLDQIPTPAPRAELVPDADYQALRAGTWLKQSLTGLGLREIMNYSLTAPGLLDCFDASNEKERIVLPHPISADQSVLRPSLIPQMTETIGRNHARQIRETLFFELGRVFRRSDDRIEEEDRVAIGLMGPVGRGPFDKRTTGNPAEMFAWLKGLVEGLMAAQDIADWSVEPLEHAFFEPGQAATILSGQTPIGVMGLLREPIRREWRMNEPVAVAELQRGPLCAGFGSIRRAEAVPVYPAIIRDMALIVDTDVNHADILRIVAQQQEKALENIELFDIFEGDAVGSGKKSMAYSVTYRSDTGTLTDEEANVYHERVKDAIKRALDVTIREG